MDTRKVKSMWGLGMLHFFLFWAEFFLAIRFVLHFFAVNPSNGFAAWIFHSTDSMVVPFRGVFPQTVSGHPHYVDLQTLFIMAAYAVAIAIMSRFLGWGYVIVSNKK